MEGVPKKFQIASKGGDMTSFGNQEYYYLSMEACGGPSQIQVSVNFPVGFYDEAEVLARASI
jgi:hypothetical protein